MSLGMPEIILIFLVVLLVFGAKRIPEIARGLGKGIREFKDATTDIKNELNVDEKRINSPRPPQQGQTTPRSESYPAHAETPKNPTHAETPNNPAHADASKKAENNS